VLMLVLLLRMKLTTVEAGKNKVGRLKANWPAKMKDGGGYGVDAGSTLSKDKLTTARW
jgi:uncharacterized protein YdgA (DUF945 family)